MWLNDLTVWGARTLEGPNSPEHSKADGAGPGGMGLLLTAPKEVEVEEKDKGLPGKLCERLWKIRRGLGM